MKFIPVTLTEQDISDLSLELDISVDAITLSDGTRSIDYRDRGGNLYICNKRPIGSSQESVMNSYVYWECIASIASSYAVHMGYDAIGEIFAEMYAAISCS